MADPNATANPTRREVLKNSSCLTASALLAGTPVVLPPVGGQETIHVAVVGCGGRGSGAAKNALLVKRGPTKLVAMADVFEDRINSSYGALSGELPDQVDVPEERRFLGFEGYKEAMDCLRPGDVVILATPPAFRWVHFTYAIQKGLHVFMEKPVTVDGPSSRRMLALGEESKKRGMKVGVGLMSRHSRAMQELHEKVRAGELGEIIAQRGYRMQGPVAFFRSLPKPEHLTDLQYQIRRFHSFLWASGGAYNDFFIHIIDQLAWMKGSRPIKAQASGGRHYRYSDAGERYVDQNLDSYSVEYTYDDGTKMMFEGRNMVNCQTRFSSYMHCTKGSAVVSATSDCGLPSSIHSDQSLSRKSRTWTSRVPDGERNPYQNEWEDLIAAIRDDTPYHEVEYGIEASMLCNMGRMAAHTGREITYEQALNCEQEFGAGVDQLTMDSASPLMPGDDGLYAVPEPGIKIDREY